MVDREKGTAAKRKRHDVRREATRLSIIEAAESLFAEQGIDAVSLRQIGAQIGAGNTSVVAYHFGDKESLIDAILHYRLPLFEQRRAELFSAAQGGDESIYSLMHMLWLPLFEQLNEEGKRSYAAFLSSLGRSSWGWVWAESEHLVPVTLNLGEKVRELMPESAQPLFSDRMIACTALITTGIRSIDQKPGLDSGAAIDRFSDSIRMAAAALAAPGNK